MKKELPPSRTADQFVVRFPDGMRERIAEAAKAAGRSMNSEIVARLQQSLDGDERMQAVFGALSQPDDYQREVLDTLQHLRTEVNELKSAVAPKRNAEAAKQIRALLAPIKKGGR